MTDLPQPHPAPTCMECGGTLEASTQVWPLDENGNRRFLDTGYPCGHVQVDTVLEADSDTIGQLYAGQAAATIRLVAVIVGGHDRTQLLALAERVTAYNGVDLCPLCTTWPHAPQCPLRHRTEETME
jgi:hypothetical protein